MTPAIGVHVDMTNPGQFFACCGLLELAHRLCPGAEGWFSVDDALFNVSASEKSRYTLPYIANALTTAGVEGDLSADQRAELENLESERRSLAKERKTLRKQDEERRSSLGKRRREGALTLAHPFNLRIAWWQEDADDVPKTFAGRQEVLRMARAMLSELPAAVKHDQPFEYRCLLRAEEEEAQTMREEWKGKRRKDSKVEPFYFDANRFAHRLDVGFSLDVQERTIRASAAPFTELLALIGLQRCRPRQTAEDKWTFEYFTWGRPLGVAVAAGVGCGAVPISGRKGFRFRLQFRDDQKRYKAFGFANPQEVRHD